MFVHASQFRCEEKRKDASPQALAVDRGFCLYVIHRQHSLVCPTREHGDRTGSSGTPDRLPPPGAVTKFSTLQAGIRFVF
jgi:hypothetical protein